MKTKIQPQAPHFQPRREPLEIAGSTGVAGGYKAPMPEREVGPSELEQFVTTELDEAQRDGETLLDLIIQNAREGRWGHSKFKDPEKLQQGVKGPSKAGRPANEATAATRASGEVEASRAQAATSASTAIQEARTEIALVTSSSASKPSEKMTERLDNLNDALALNKALREHI